MILAVPSWVVPGTYLENLHFLESKKNIAVVELLFFIYNDAVKDEFDAEWEHIIKYKNRFTFTAHLPDPLLPLHAELIEKLLPQVKHFIIHGGDEQLRDGGADFIASMQEIYGADKFVLENTSRGRLEKLLEQLSDDTKVCMDCGHLLLDNKNPNEFFKRYSADNRISEIHLHGVDIQATKRDGRLPDHRPISLRINEMWFLELKESLKNFEGIVNIEVFNWNETVQTLLALKGYLL